MTEQTTTEILSDALEEVEDGDKASNVQRRSDHAFWASQAFMRLHAALTSGSTLPAQWPQAKELEELRAKVAKYEASLRGIVHDDDPDLALIEFDSRGHRIAALEGRLQGSSDRATKLEVALQNIAGYRKQNNPSDYHGGRFMDSEDFDALESIAEEALKP